ncbi:uncharacterized protein Z518_00577 [Rhinocladiella mackenziei CBS 650.93]|uniref:Uncharacterized protein n=1 Tax=Rhinocladiella mackenziei CBS 650.93 TaxID=1442369 RepID=A0A0D2G4C5_9EURO|nr:uncharacterized protein Z518_00577 [Rhinocladiella mackenziei CBS 650.93]KIX09497.1 hypothetical protein Z518_00577 [Rhinocladiella mackenziei CBS 650.93]
MGKSTIHDWDSVAATQHCAAKMDMMIKINQSTTSLAQARTALLRNILHGESPTGFPFMQLYLNVTDSTVGATILSLIICLIATAANAAGLTSTSRTFWAFARDESVPFSKYFAHVHDGLKVPVRMIVLVSVLQALLGFIYLGNTTAFNAILSMAIIGMYLSYILPIVYMLLCGRPRLSTSEYGPFKLGRISGMLINIFAIMWLVFAMVFSTFPNFQPVTPQNMNYSTVVLAGWIGGGAPGAPRRRRMQHGSGPRISSKHTRAQRAFIVNMWLTHSRGKSSEWAWRLPIIVMQIYPTVLFVGANLLLQTPRWYVLQGDNERAIRRVFGKDQVEQRIEELVTARRKEQREAIEPLGFNVSTAKYITLGNYMDYLVIMTVVVAD